MVTGGSRGLGKGIVRALAREGAQVWAIARNERNLEELKAEITGVHTLTIDISASDAASRVFATATPDILVLNAGALPHLAPVQDHTWEQFELNWDTDVKSTFHFGKEALRSPMSPGSKVITVSSGAAVSGSPASGGYAGAKRTQWFLSEYFQKESDALGLGIRFVVVLPKQIVGTTELGNNAATTYAKRAGMTKEEFLASSEPALSPDGFGDGVASVLSDEAYRDGLAFAIGGAGIEQLN